MPDEVSTFSLHSTPFKEAIWIPLSQKGLVSIWCCVEGKQQYVCRKPEMYSRAFGNCATRYLWVTISLEQY